MALFGKETGKERVDGSGEPPASATRGEGRTMTDQRVGSAAGTDAFLGKGSQISGKVVLSGTGRIEGKVEGEIAAQDTLVIGESAIVNAQVSGETIVIHGRVTGDVTARQKLELRSGSKVAGNISAPRLIVEEGAVFEGNCKMGAVEVGRDKGDVSVLLNKKPPQPEKHDESHRASANA